ncbi:MAG: SAM-dependent methyltransferase [Parcubacteria group bacterium Gr01-1014_38]|nr:MAG: SAM-dependent methyltransferase [Parcubacteria group bacterium Gr01-1014_38]
MVLSLFFGALALTAYAAWRGAPWLPTPRRAVGAGLAAASVQPGDVVVDIGAGDGRVLVAAARRGATAVGYELSPFLWVFAWFRTRRNRARVTVRLADGFRADLSAATVIFAFLRPATMPLLAAALAHRRTQHPVRVLSYAFPLPGTPAAEVLRLPGCAPLYRYTVSSHG